MLPLHPELDENGLPVPLFCPNRSSGPEVWTDPARAATYAVTDPVEIPPVGSLPWNDAPGRPDEGYWRALAERLADLPEPAPPATTKRLTSGAIVVEPDRRVWVVHPSNFFGAILATYPKGRLEPGLTLAANAVKETWEESGLLVEPVAWLVDIERRATVTRYYLARRTGGCPQRAGWESQAVSLVPVEELGRFVNRTNDRKATRALVEALARGAFGRIEAY